MTRQGRRVPERVQDMLEAIHNARADLGDLDLHAFLADGKTQRAVIESIIVLGEAANKILAQAPALKDENAELWRILRDAYDMRIVLTHEYFRVDAAIVWTTVKNNLPELERTLMDFALED